MAASFHHWFNSVPVALTNHGRVNVENGGFDAVDTDNPRLYSVAVAVTNAQSGRQHRAHYGSGTGHALVLALSGTTGSLSPIIDVQPTSVSAFSGNPVNLGIAASGTGALQFQWQRETNGTFVNLSNGAGFAGVTTTNLAISSAASDQAGSYRVIVSNPSGSTTSQVVSINVLSNGTDVTSADDQITSFGGTSPAAEMVANAVDKTTAKYPNFGTDNDQVSPFVGPVGLIITPASGSSTVTGLRVFTANDAPERDPIDYKLEGSNDVRPSRRSPPGPCPCPPTGTQPGRRWTR